jgi:hypothetical protein
VSLPIGCGARPFFLEISPSVSREYGSGRFRPRLESRRNNFVAVNNGALIAPLLFFLAAIGIASSTPSPQTSAAPNGVENHSPPNSYTTVASPHPPSVAEKSTEDGKSAEQDDYDRKHSVLVWCKRYETIINIGCALTVAIFTSILTIFTVKLWRSGEKHSERELRAYVGVTDASIQVSKNPEQPLIKAEMTIRNAGQTPAYDLNVVATFDFHEIPRTEFAPYNNAIKQSRSTLGPGSEVDVPLVAPKLLTADHLKAVKEEKFAFFFYGKIKYRDAFWKERFTDFRYITTADKSGPLTWQVTEEGNESN